MTGAGRLPFTGRPTDLLDYWRSVLSFGEAGEIEGRLRRFDGVLSLFLSLRLRRSTTTEGLSNGRYEHRHRRRSARNACLPRGIGLEMTAKGNALDPFSSYASCRQTPAGVL